MTWTNAALNVFHGTDSVSGNSIRINGVLPSRFNPNSDFGAGFYVTTSLHQAKNWANERVRAIGAGTTAEVLQYSLARSALENLTHLAFVTDSQDYHELVEYCWRGGANHGRSKAYDAVYGPVSLWPQTLVIANCDQICFPDPLNVKDSSGTKQFKAPTKTFRASPSTYF